MKKYLIIFVFVLLSGSLYSQTCFYYISVKADEDFKVYKGESLKYMITNVFKADCDEIEESIELEFGEAIKSKYPNDYMYISGEYVWKFDTENAALKARRKEIGDLKSDGWKIIDFNFTYYGD